MNIEYKNGANEVLNKFQKVVKEGTSRGYSSIKLKDLMTAVNELRKEFK